MSKEIILASLNNAHHDLHNWKAFFGGAQRAWVSNGEWPQSWRWTRTSSMALDIGRQLAITVLDPSRR
jgi:hypothetical protein